MAGFQEQWNDKQAFTACQLSYGHEFREGGRGGKEIDCEARMGKDGWT